MAFTRLFSRKRRDPIVNFLVCGTQKGGTNALDSYLREHPEICMARMKEVHFFDDEEMFARRRPDYSVYHASFDPRPEHRLIGEATPIYMYWNSSPRRIWEYNPDMKIIVILRNPIDRAYSHWNMERSRNNDNVSFWDAINSEEERCRQALPLQHRYYSYIDRGYYVSQLRRLWFYFSKKRVLVIRNEYLRNHPLETLRDICEFLEVEPYKNIENRDVYSLPYQAEMSLKERAFLLNIFKYEIRELESILGWDCSNWLAAP